MATANLLLIAAIAAAPSSPEEAIRGLCAAGRFDLAIEALERFLGGPGAAALGPRERFDLEKLRARCLFELGDYPSYERQVRELLAGPAGPETADHGEWLAHLAEALSFQDVHDQAIATLERALRLAETPALHRLAITLLLRAGRIRDALPHAESLLAADPAEPLAHFIRGIVLADENREEAIPELSWGLKISGAARDARLRLAEAWGKLNRPESSLEHLLEIVAGDPHDREACYRAAQQWGRMRAPAAAEMAAHLKDYFLALDKARGASSRDWPVEALGRASPAAIMRADEWRRLGAYDRAIAEIRRAEAVARGDPEPFLYEADFWAGVGLLAEAESVLSRLEAAQPGGATVPLDVAARIAKLRAALSASKERLRARASTPVGKARLAAAEASWQDVRPRLEALLAAAVAAGELSVADTTARLLLARDPESVRALAFLAQRAAEPALLIPRLHYLTRLARLLPDDEQSRGKLAEARAQFLGTSSAPPGSR